MNGSVGVLTRRRVVASVVALACVTAWVTLIAPASTSSAAAPVGQTVRASVANNGSESVDGGYHSVLSGNGRYDAFVSTTPGLAPGAGLGCQFFEGAVCQRYYPGIYVRDLETGHTTLITAGWSADGPTVYGSPADNASDYPTLSKDGRYIAFMTSASWSTNFDFATPTNPEGAQTLVVCDRDPNHNGVFDERVRHSSATDPGFNIPCQPVNVVNFPLGADGAPHLSADGKRIVWAERPGDDNDQVSFADIPMAANGVLGAGPYVSATHLVPLEIVYAGDARQGTDSSQPAISADGRFIVGQLSVPANPRFLVIFEWQVDTSGDPRPTRRIDVSPLPALPAPPPPFPSYVGQGNEVGRPQVSSNGTRVVFEANNEGFFSSYPDVYATTVDTGQLGNPQAEPAHDTVIVSALPDGSAAGGPGDGAYPAISADGRYVAFVTDRAGMYDGPIPNQLSDFSCLNPSSGFAAGAFAGAPAPAAAAKPAVAAPRPAPAAAPPLTPSPTSTSGAAGTRTPCQVVERDLVADAANVTAGDPFAKAHLASPHAGPNAVPACATDNLGNPCAGSDDSTNPVSLSATGGRVAYDSNAPDLIDNDTNARSFGPGGFFAGTDAFVRTWTPALTAAPIAFGDVLLGQSSSQPLTFTVTGFGPVTIDSITPGGTDHDDFTVTTNCTPPVKEALHENDPCTVQVTFTPGAAGPRSGTLGVFAPGSGTTPTITIPVTGTGSGTPAKIPQFSGTPDPLTFGSHIPLKTPGLTRAATITNPGSGLLTVTAVTVLDGSVPGAHSDYTVDFTDCAGGIAHLATCQILVTWVGHAVGNRPAILQIVDNAPGGLNLIGLRATVPKPTMTVNPGVSPTGRVVTVSGIGFAPKRLVDIVLKDQNESATVKTDAQGKFSTGLVLFPNGDEGPRTVTAHSHGASATIAAVGPLLIVLGSLDSPTLVMRH
jgi:hypothetical protein